LEAEQRSRPWCEPPTSRLASASPAAGDRIREFSIPASLSSFKWVTEKLELAPSLRYLNRSMGRRPIVWLIPAFLLISTVAFLVLRWSNSLEVEFADGRIIRVEAVTYGTSHVVGRSASWVGPLRKVLPSRLATVLISSREQSRLETEIPSLVVWLHAFDPEKQIYLDSQGLQIMLVDEHRDVYPSNSSAHFSFGSGFNRQAHVFAVFPRRPSKLNLHLKPWRASG
jgi:hypothetical protein